MITTNEYHLIEERNISIYFFFLFSCVCARFYLILISFHSLIGVILAQIWRFKTMFIVWPYLRETHCRFRSDRVNFIARDMSYISVFCQKRSAHYPLKLNSGFYVIISSPIHGERHMIFPPADQTSLTHVNVTIKVIISCDSKAGFSQSFHFSFCSAGTSCWSLTA